MHCKKCGFNMVFDVECKVCGSVVTKEDLEFCQNKAADESEAEYQICAKCKSRLNDTMVYCPVCGTNRNKTVKDVAPSLEELLPEEELEKLKDDALTLGLRAVIFGSFFIIPGIVFGAMAINKAKKIPASQRLGKARAGEILGRIEVILSTIGFAIMGSCFFISGISFFSLFFKYFV